MTIVFKMTIVFRMTIIYRIDAVWSPCHLSVTSPFSQGGLFCLPCLKGALGVFAMWQSCNCVKSMNNFTQNRRNLGIMTIFGHSTPIYSFTNTSIISNAEKIVNIRGIKTPKRLNIWLFCILYSDSFVRFSQTLIFEKFSHCKRFQSGSI